MEAMSSLRSWRVVETSRISEGMLMQLKLDSRDARPWSLFGSRILQSRSINRQVSLDKIRKLYGRKGVNSYSNKAETQNSTYFLIKILHFFRIKISRTFASKVKNNSQLTSDRLRPGIPWELGCSVWRIYHCSGVSVLRSPLRCKR